MQMLIDLSQKIRRSLPLLLTGFAFLVTQAAFGDSLQFTLLPADGNIAGSPGSTVGWGYSLTNQSASDWLVTTNLTADSFLHGTPALLFDFPNLGPGQTVTELFNANAGVGLYKFTWNADAPVDFVNSGLFVLSAQWWDGDPANGGSYLATAPDTNVSYSVTASSTRPVPEPSTIAFVILSLLATVAGKTWISIRRW